MIMKRGHTSNIPLLMSALLMEEQLTGDKPKDDPKQGEGEQQQ